MLMTIFAVLVVLWLLGMVSLYTRWIHSYRCCWPLR